MSQVEKKQSAVEGFKQSSNFLRGDIAQEIVDGEDHFGKGSVQLLKFHGTYQQDDRDARKANRAAGAGKAFMFMVRTRIPGGALTSDQLLAELDMCDELGDGTLRVTSRQGLQLHGVLKENLRETIRRIHAVKLTTLAACGDVERNVMCCPAPIADGVRDQLQDLTLRFADHFAPRTKSYREIWLIDPDTGERTAVDDESDDEPIYGPTYLPRKFKTGVALPGDNCVDLYSQDLGLLAIVEDDRLRGFNLLVGGGFGVTPSNANTFPAVAQPMAYVDYDQVIPAAEAIIKVQRDFGERGDRKRARMKYLIHDWGLPAFREKVEEYYGSRFADPRPAPVTEHDDHIGWREQGDGRWFYGLNVENGRIKNDGDFKLKSALRQICKELKPSIRLTAHQSILFCDLAEEARDRLEGMLVSHGVPTSGSISTVRRWSMACVAWPTCGLAVAESERALPGVVDQIEAELAKQGLADQRFAVRMTGCPNGCARPYNSDVGLVGRTLGKYTIYLGGRVQGDRLNFRYKDLVPAEHVAAELAPLLTYFKETRRPGEAFGDFCARSGLEDLLAHGLPPVDE